MSRVNIEECWWTDPRRTKLIGLLEEELRADGLAVRIWRIAQQYWGNGLKLIPIKIWAAIDENDKFLQAFLAEERAGGIYVYGSEDYLTWIDSKRKKAKAGGRRSAQRPRDAKGRLLKRSTVVEPSGPQAVSKSDQVESKVIHPSGSDSGSDSVSSSASENTSYSKPQAFIASYSKAFKRRWGYNPEITKKDAGIAARLTQTLSPEKVPRYFDAFFQMPDAWLQKTKHPLSAFESKLNEIVVFANGGEFTSAKQAFQTDGALAVASQIQRIREGKV